jgi:hypothetical protein
MIEPFPYARSICAIATFSALPLSSLTSAVAILIILSSD